MQKGIMKKLINPTCNTRTRSRYNDRKKEVTYDLRGKDLIPDQDYSGMYNYCSYL